MCFASASTICIVLSAVWTVKRQKQHWRAVLLKIWISAFSGQDISISKYTTSSKRNVNRRKMTCSILSVFLILLKKTEIFCRGKNSMTTTFGGSWPTNGKGLLFKGVITELFSTGTSGSVGSFQLFFVPPPSQPQSVMARHQLGWKNILNFCHRGFADVSVFAPYSESTKKVEIPKIDAGLLSRKGEKKILKIHLEMSEVTWYVGGLKWWRSEHWMLTLE